MSNETICVIGVSGFIGSNVAAELLDRGYDIHGTTRNPKSNREWLEAALSPPAETSLSPTVTNTERRLTIFEADVSDQDALEAAMKGCTGVIMSAGVEHQEPGTVSTMLAAAQNTLQAAANQGIDRVVFTSSTGSCNPPGDEPDTKNELDHWSDPAQQISVEKFSPAAKTLMERLAMGLGDKLGIRVAIMNPSLILGPSSLPETPSSLEFIGRIMRGERMREQAANGSMSIIDVRDLAKLHVAALEDDDASGRYFGVKESWHWQDILEALDRVYEPYSAPKWPDGENRTRPTGYDLTRQQTLGVDVRGLDAIMEGAVAELRRRGQPGQVWEPMR
jgi:cinnamoyl-CoA reductase